MDRPNLFSLASSQKVFGNNATEDAFVTDGHLVAEDRLLLLSDAVGDITAVDLRTNTKARHLDAVVGWMFSS